jgi:hypothetical protein
MHNFIYLDNKTESSCIQNKLDYTDDVGLRHYIYRKTNLTQETPDSQFRYTNQERTHIGFKHQHTRFTECSKATTDIYTGIKTLAVYYFRQYTHTRICVDNTSKSHITVMHIKNITGIDAGFRLLNEGRISTDASYHATGW